MIQRPPLIFYYPPALSRRQRHYFSEKSSNMALASHADYEPWRRCFLLEARCWRCNPKSPCHSTEDFSNQHPCLLGLTTAKNCAPLALEQQSMVEKTAAIAHGTGCMLLYLIHRNDTLSISTELHSHSKPLPRRLIVELCPEVLAGCFLSALPSLPSTGSLTGLRRCTSAQTG